VKLLISKRKFLMVVTVCLLVVVIYWLMNWLLDPMRALKGFLEAIEQKDIDRIYSMTLSEERKAGLSKEQVAKVVGDLFYRHGNVKSEILITHRIADRWLYGYVLWWKVENGQKKPLPRTKNRASNDCGKNRHFSSSFALEVISQFYKVYMGIASLQLCTY